MILDGHNIAGKYALRHLRVLRWDDNPPKHRKNKPANQNTDVRIGVSRPKLPTTAHRLPAR